MLDKLAFAMHTMNSINPPKACKLAKDAGSKSKTVRISFLKKLDDVNIDCTCMYRDLKLTYSNSVNPDVEYRTRCDDTNCPAHGTNPDYD